MAEVVKALFVGLLLLGQADETITDLCPDQIGQWQDHWRDVQ